jgi:hypothetical protein
LRRLMAHRSDRRGDEPITIVAFKGRETDWLPARDFPSWPGCIRRPLRVNPKAS